jgi:hypothetical protein
VEDGQRGAAGAEGVCGVDGGCVRRYAVSVSCPILGTTPNHGYPSYGTNLSRSSQLVNLARPTFAQNAQFRPQPRSATGKRPARRNRRRRQRRNQDARALAVGE